MLDDTSTREKLAIHLCYSLVSVITEDLTLNHASYIIDSCIPITVSRSAVAVATHLSTHSKKSFLAEFYTGKGAGLRLGGRWD